MYVCKQECNKNIYAEDNLSTVHSPDSSQLLLGQLKYKATRLWRNFMYLFIYLFIICEIKLST